MARAARRDPTPRELDERLTKLERRIAEIAPTTTASQSDELRAEMRKGFADAHELIDRKIREAQSSNDVMFKMLFRQREDDRVLADQRQAAADQRHAEIMAQFEKLLRQPPEN